MKREMSIKEFQTYISKYTPAEISFCSENQNWYTATDPLKIKMVFSTILIDENPNIICLKDGVKKEFYFYRVKNVYIDNTASVLGVVFYICCEDEKNQDSNNKIYTLIAS